MKKPKYELGQTLYILTEWEGCYGSSFKPILIKQKKDGTVFYFDPHPNWHEDDFYEGSFDGWWPEDLLSDSQCGGEE